MEGTEELVPFVGMGAKEALLALLQLLLSSLDCGSQAALFCNKSGDVIVHVMILLELSYDPPIFLGS